MPTEETAKLIVEPDIHPAGYKRDEQTAINKDNLAEEIDKQSENTMAIDPSKLNVDREIRYELDNGELDVVDADPKYVYKWVQCEAPRSNPSRLINQLRYRRVKVNGTWYPTWQVVNGEMKEATALKNATGLRQLGDCILMRCHKNTYNIIEAEERRKRVNRQQGLDSQLVELAASAGTKAGEVLYQEHANRR